MLKVASSSLAALAVLSLVFVDSCSCDEYIRPPPKKNILISTVHSPSQPQQVHISLVGKDHMRVTYITEDKHAPSLVEYGTSSVELEMSATGQRTSYRYFFYKSAWIHHVTIGPLASNTVYHYRCGALDTIYSFKTPPSSLPLHFAITGDLGQTEWTSSTLAHINAKDYDVLLLPGDLSYADANQPLWDSFGKLMEPLASTRPWMVTQGNHEMEGIAFFKWIQDPFSAYNHRWRMPYEESGSTSNLYYSFDVAEGTVHVIMLGSYTDFGSDSDQYRWLVGDLNRIDRKVTSWIVVLLHAPWYNTNTAHQGEGESMRKAMEDLLYKARVDVIFAGHVHAYQRFTRVYDNMANKCGPVHITIGDGGNREGLATNFDKNHKSASLSLFQEASFGHGRLEVVNKTHARWSWHRNDDVFSTVRDEVWLNSLISNGECGKRGSFENPLIKDEL